MVLPAIAGASIILGIFAFLVLGAISFAFFKNIVIAIVLGGVGLAVVYKTLDNLDKKQQQMAFGFGIILILVGLFVGTVQPFSIVGASEVFVGKPYSASIDITSLVSPDGDFSDGSMIKVYGVTAIFDSAGNKVFSSPQVELSNNRYLYELNYTFSKKGDYYIVALLGETHASFDFTSKSWSAWSAPTETGNEKFKVSVIEVGAPTTQPNFSLFDSLFNFLKEILALVGVKL